MSLSLLQKHKKDNDNMNSSPPLKKQKLYHSLNQVNSSFSFPSIICINDFSSSTCNNFTLCISNNKNISSVGCCAYKAHGHEENKIFPIKQIQGVTNIKMIDCGYSHSICLNYNGDVYSFGSNNNGKLGIGNDKEELEFTYIPQKIYFLPSCKQVSCGNEFTIVLTEDNRLYSFGNNTYGQLGLGNYYKYYSSPQLIPDLYNIEYIICGGYHCICKTYNTEFYSWGYNYCGQLGIHSAYNRNKPNQCNNWPDNIISIKCGYNFSFLLTLEGQIYSFGKNSYGQLGLNDKTLKANIPTLIIDIPEIQRIECGDFHSMCIDINNNLWIFGFNEYGQLGLGDKEYRYKPILHPTLSNIIDISSRGNHTFVKTIDNKIYAFGYNKYSQLGIKTSEDNQLTPIQVFIDKEDIWCSIIGKSKQKSARK